MNYSEILDKYPLTDSNKGGILDWKKFPSEGNRGLVLRSLLNDLGFIVIKNAGQRIVDAQNIMKNLGELVEHEKRKEGVLSIDGSKDEEEVLRGQEHMPLHKDGLLMGLEVGVVGIFCERLSEVTGGRTFISDMYGSMDDISKEDLKILEENGIEGQPVDTSYYLAEGDKWHPIQAVINKDGLKLLNMGFLYEDDQRASWRLRVPNIDREKSKKILNDVNEVMMRPTHTYYHDWSEGDMILMDNQRMLHGRESFTGTRVLANLQVLD